MKVPDFDSITKVADEIFELSKKKGLLELQLKYEESQIMLKCMTDPTYFQGGKPPSVAFVDSTYKIPGLNGELMAMRREVAEATSQLERARLTWEIFKQQFELYRTESANNRTVNQII